MTSNFKLVTLAVLTTHRHSITRCSRTVAFHMNSNNNRSHVCSRLWMLLHLGKLLKADYRVKKQMFSEDLAHPNTPVCARQYPKPPRTDKKKASHREWDIGPLSWNPHVNACILQWNHRQHATNRRTTLNHVTDEEKSTEDWNYSCFASLFKYSKQHSNKKNPQVLFR